MAILTVAKDWTKHAVERTISVVCVLAVLAGIGWAGYVAFVKPHTKPTPSTSNNAQVIYIYHYNFYPNKKVFGLGGTLWGMDIGLSKYDYPKEPNTITKQTVVK